MKSEYLQSLMTTIDGNPIDIPIEGNLGLLALGDIGLIAWRLKKREHNEAIRNNSKSQDHEGKRKE